MFDALIVKQLKEPLDLLARPLARSRVSADSLTLIGGFFGVSGAFVVSAQRRLAEPPKSESLTLNSS